MAVDGPHRETAIERALVEMRAVRLPDPLPPGGPAPERHRRVREVVEGQEQRRREVTGGRETEQQEPGQKPDRERADVAEEQPRDRPVRGREAEERPAERGREPAELRRGGPGDRDERDGPGERHALRDRDPVDPVHEVHEVDPPGPGEDQEAALERDRDRFREDAAGIGEPHHERDHGHLHDEPDQRRERPDVVDPAEQGQGQRRPGQQDEAGHRREPADQPVAERRNREGRAHDRDPATLGRRHAVARARVRARERVADEERAEEPDQRGAEPCRGQRRGAVIRQEEAGAQEIAENVSVLPSRARNAPGMAALTSSSTL